ncbi:MAG: hypothetical protein KAW00_05150 [Dehalococcoidia bacterium]|nr:hypothetical protein [Dehalococcoidia bacterium]
MKKLLSLAVILMSIGLLCLGTVQVQAQVGVGIMPGIIRVDEPLLPGGHYKLPSLQVVNTGQEASEYEVELARMAEQKELQPPPEFISFSPKSFYLEPGANQVVSLSLAIPVKAKPGDYLAYIEAHPVSPGNGMTIGIAAATKLFFTIKPANIVVGIFAAISSFFSTRAPISYIVLGVVALGIAVFFLRRRISFEVRVGRK